MRKLITRALAVAAVLAAAACAEFKDPPVLTKHLVDESIGTIERFRAKDTFREFSPMLDSATAVMIFPSVVKAGFVGAAEGGSGVLLARRADGSWSYPAFYTLAAGSVGLQIGIQNTEVVLVVRNPGALESILKHQGKLGADVGISVGTMGVGAEASTTTNMRADVVAFVNTTLGVFGGLSLEGAGLVRRTDLAQSYYGQPAQPRDIVLGPGFANPHADGLRTMLSRRR